MEKNTSISFSYALLQFAQKVTEIYDEAATGKMSKKEAKARLQLLVAVELNNAQKAAGAIGKQVQIE